MKARAVHSLVAAGLHDPTLLARWSKYPETFVALAPGSDALDVATLRKFAGLVAMVRHNGLREDLPRTFRFLATAGLGIVLFADYSEYLARADRRLSGSSAQRAADLAAFVGCWIDGTADPHRRLHDLIRHEVALVTLGEVKTTPRASPGETGPASSDSVPVIVGALILHRFDHDPRESDLQAGDTMLGYWRATADAPIRILRLDLLCYELLRRLDGQRSAATLALALTGDSPSPAFLAALDELVRVGVVTLAKS